MRAIEDALRRLPPVRLVELDPAHAGVDVDAFATVEIGGRRLRFALEWKDSLDPRGVDRLVVRLGAVPGDALPAVVSRYVPPSIRRRLEEHGVGWIDALGNAHLEADGVLVHIERPTPRGSVPRPRGDIFGASSGRVVQALLEDPGDLFTLESLRLTASVRAPSTVSRALSGLVEAGLAVRDAEGWRVPDPGGLLDAWLDAALKRPAPRRLGYFSRDPITDVRGRLLAVGSDLEPIVTGPAAAEMLRPLLPATQLDLYVFPPARSSWFGEHAMSWIPTASAPNVSLWVATNDGPRIGRAVVHDVPIVGRAQLILDLNRVGGRSMQVADDLRREWRL